MSLFGILPLKIPKDFEMGSLPVEKVKVQKFFALIREFMLVLLQLITK